MAACYHNLTLEDEIVESDVELERDTVEPDNDPPQKMGHHWK
ncbi:unnamed protein product [Brassica oleracea var. botrytis]